MQSPITSTLLTSLAAFLVLVTIPFCGSSSSTPTNQESDQLIIQHFQQIVGTATTTAKSEQQENKINDEGLTLEEGLVRLEETTQALTFLLNQFGDENNSDNDDKDDDGGLKDLLTKAVGYTQRVKEITIDAAAAAAAATTVGFLGSNVEEELLRLKRTPTTTEGATTGRRRLSLQASARQHQSYNKAKRHFRLHDALVETGEKDDISALLQRHMNKLSTGSSNGSNRRRRHGRRRRKLQNPQTQATTKSSSEEEEKDDVSEEEEEEEDDGSDDDEDDEPSGSDVECKAVVKCLRTWTIVDVMSYFFLNDEGGIEDDATDDKLLKKAKRIAKKLSVFPKDDVEETIDLGPKCNALLSVFEDEDNTTWKKICDAQPKYVSFEDIQDKFGSDIAVGILEDFILCSPDDVQELFLDVYPRIPTNYNPHDHHKNDKWEYKNFKIYDQYVVDKIAGGSDNITMDASDDCQDQIEDIYKEMFLEENDEDRSPYIYKRKFEKDDDDDDLPKLVLNCTRTNQNTDWSCGIQARREEDDDDDEDLLSDVECQVKIRPGVDLSCSEEHSTTTTTSCQVEADVDSLFEGAAEEEEDGKSLLDVATKLVLGEEVSTGLVCKHQGEAPGFCCLDQPEDDFTLGYWGSKFNCDFGESECQNKAPLLSGFSEETCSMYKGTYCLKQVDCEELLECIKEEKEWAEKNGRITYHNYLDAGPEVEEEDEEESSHKCGSLREYHGFADDEDNRDVCSGIRQLRSNPVFEELDKSLMKDGGQKQQQQISNTTTTRFGNFNLKLNLPPRQKDQQQVDSMKLGDLDEFSEKFVEPKDPERSEEYFHQKKVGLYQFKQILSTLEETLVVLEVHTCPSDPTFEAYNKCVEAKNVMSAVLVASLFVSKRIFQTIEYFYLENDALSDFDLNKMYQNVMTTQGNLDVLAEYAAVIRDNQQVLRDNQEVLSNQIKEIGGTGGTTLDKNAMGDTSNTKVLEKIDGTNSLVADVRVKLKADMVNLNSGAKLHVTQKTDEILQKIEQTCSAPAARRHLNVGCTDESLKVTCAFNQKGLVVSEDKKSLFVQEASRKINTGVIYDIMGACSDVVEVSISVLSNEVDERQSAFLSKGIRKDTGEELPRVYVAPRMCKDDGDEEDDPCTVDTICEPSASGKRLYEIHITAKDGVSGETAQDTCRVVVLPRKSQEGELRGGHVDQLTEQEQRELVEASPVMNFVGTLLLQNQNHFT